LNKTSFQVIPHFRGELLVTKLELGLPAARLPRAWQAGNEKLSHFHHNCAIAIPIILMLEF